MSVELITELAEIEIANHAGGFQVLLSLLYGVPLLAAVSLQNDSRILRVSRIVHGILSLTIGAVIYLEIFRLIPAHGSADQSTAVLLTYLFDAMDLFLAITSSIRWIAASEGHECTFFRILTIFLWLNVFLPALHNRLLLHHDYIWLDLLIATPYVILIPTALGKHRKPERILKPALIGIVRSGSSIFLAGVLVLIAVVIAPSYFYVGLVAAMIAIACYATLNITFQSRGLKNEELLLESKAKLERLVEIDGLTGIANRRAFDEVFLREFALTRRTHRPLSLLMIDIDFFKGLNDAKGHLVGDQYLIRIATALSLALTRSTDFIARYGGEEFSAILPATDSTGAMVAAEKLRRAVEGLALKQPAPASLTGVVTVSIGVATFDGTLLCDPADLLETADKALYAAKRAGRNCSEFQPLNSTVEVIQLAIAR